MGPGTFLTQDEGGSGLGSGFLVDLVPRPPEEVEVYSKKMVS